MIGYCLAAMPGLYFRSRLSTIIDTTKRQLQRVLRDGLWQTRFCHFDVSSHFDDSFISISETAHNAFVPFIPKLSMYLVCSLAISPSA